MAGAGLADQLPDAVEPHSFDALHHNLEMFPNLATTLNGNGRVYALTVGPPHERSAIFLSPRMARVMVHCREVFTSMLKINAAPPNQDCELFIYQVSRIFHDNVISLMLAIMQTPSYEALRATLLSLQTLEPSFHPHIVYIPYCEKEKGAWEEVFHCITQFSFTSYLKELLESFHHYEIFDLVSSDSNVRSLLRSLLSIPLLPFGMMRRGFKIMINRAEHSVHCNRMVPFLHYYFDIWMKGDRYETLSCFIQSSRLSNASDVATRNLLKKTGVHYPDIWYHINAIQRYELISYSTVRKLERGLSAGHGQKVTSLKNDLVIRNCTMELMAGDMSIKKFLKVTSTRIINVLFHSP